MNYKLAKELADKGFPYLQRFHKLREVVVAVIPPAGKIRSVEAPTLSELIDALGNDFYQLEKTPVSNWKASGTHDGIIYHEFEALTPEEVVAKLWLELNHDDNGYDQVAQEKNEII